jgi:hypothetical protein
VIETISSTALGLATGGGGFFTGRYDFPMTPTGIPRWSYPYVAASRAVNGALWGGLAAAVLNAARGLIGDRAHEAPAPEFREDYADGTRSRKT